MDDLVIRRACDTDFEQLCRLYSAFHEFHVHGVPDRLRTLGEPTQVDCTALVANLRLLIARADATLLVAVEADAVIGLAELYLRDDGEHAATIGYRHVYLQSLMVTEHARHRHIGTRLIEASHAWAEQQRAYELRLEIWEFADGPLRFYERAGFRTLRRTLVRPIPVQAPQPAVPRPQEGA